MENGSGLWSVFLLISKNSHHFFYISELFVHFSDENVELLNGSFKRILFCSK